MNNHRTTPTRLGGRNRKQAATKWGDCEAQFESIFHTDSLIEQMDDPCIGRQMVSVILDV